MPRSAYRLWCGCIALLLLAGCGAPTETLRSRDGKSDVETTDDAPAEAAATGVGLPERSAAERERWSHIGPRNTVLFSPRSDLYPRYLADPRRPQVYLLRSQVIESDIEEVSNGRWHTALGVSSNFVRVHANGLPDRGFQFDAGAAIFAQFDAEVALDNIGWDGVYHFTSTWRTSDVLSYKFGLRHLSSHLGDEYIEKTGRTRIKYTREELAAGISVQPWPHWRTYLEAGYSWELRDFQESWRLQGGLEYRSAPVFLGGRMSWYAATDVQGYQESDWDPGVSAQLGLLVPVDDLGRIYRVGMQYYNGRSTLGEFFDSEEEYLQFGIWLDL